MSYGSYASSPESEEQRRRRRIVALGIMLLLGFLLPVLYPNPFGGGTRATFLNFEILGESNAPGLVTFMFLYPGLAGIAVIVLALACRATARSVALIAVGVLPLVVLMLDQDVQKAAAVMRQFPGSASIWVVVLALAGCGGILTGIRALHYRSSSWPAAIIGAIGGGLYLLSLFLPVLPKAMGRVCFAVPFKMFTAETVPAALGALGQMVCLMLASALCLMTLAQTYAARALADGAFKFLVWSGVIYLLGMIFQVMFSTTSASLFLFFLSPECPRPD